MPWIPRPFDYYGTASNQVLEDLEQANDNFEILGKCFVNDDPTTGKVKVAETINGFRVSDIPMPNAIPVAGPDGTIDSNWLYPLFYAGVSMSSNQYIPPGVWTKIAFEYVYLGGYYRLYDYSLSVPFSGLYLIIASINLYLDGSGTKTKKRIRIQINDNYPLNEATNDGSAGDGANIWTQAILFLEANDKISIYGYFGTGGTVYAQHSWFYVFRLK